MATALSKQWHKHWHQLIAGTPGRRFRDRYYRNQRSEKTHPLQRIGRWILALVAFAGALVLTVIPGPAIPLFFLAGALIASDWLWMAKTLDWVEVKARAIWKKLARIWHRLPRSAHVALVILGCCCSVALTYGTYRLMQ